MPSHMSIYNQTSRLILHMKEQIISDVHRVQGTSQNIDALQLHLSIFN